MFCQELFGNPQYAVIAPTSLMTLYWGHKIHMEQNITSQHTHNHSPNVDVFLPITSCDFLFLGIHGKIDRCLVHVNDEAPVVIAAADNETHELHEVEGLALNFASEGRICLLINIFVQLLCLQS